MNKSISLLLLHPFSCHTFHLYARLHDHACINRQCKTDSILKFDVLKFVCNFLTYVFIYLIFVSISKTYFSRIHSALYFSHFFLLTNYLQGLSAERASSLKLTFCRYDLYNSSECIKMGIYSSGLKRKCFLKLQWRKRFVDFL